MTGLVIDNLTGGFSAPCPVPWCQRQHDGEPPARVHRLDVGPFPGPSQEDSDLSAPVFLLLYQAEDQHGQFDDAVVRIVYQVHGHEKSVEMTPTLAADLGDIVLARAGDSQREFARALEGLCHFAWGAQ